MHESARKTALSFFEEYGLNGSADVLEIGALDVDGSLRESLPDQMRWVGVDLVPGPGVDVVLEDAYSLPFNDKEFDLAIATSVLEHDEMFWLSFLEMVRVVRSGGFVYLCSPSNGHIHRFPVDCYRFYPDAGAALAKWARRSGYEVTLLESFILRKDSSEWNDWCAVFFIGYENEAPVVANRLSTALNLFAVGMRGTNLGELPLTQATEDQLELHGLSIKLARAQRMSPVHLCRRALKKIRSALSVRDLGPNV